MAWLITHMWIVVVATGMAAALLGGSVRGMLLSGKMRRAMVERDMVKVELSNSKEEVEKLFAQIRKLQNGDLPATAPAVDPILTRKLDSLTAELARKSAEIDALKTAAATGPVAAPGAAAAPSGPAEEATLAWRNRHLEGRVAHLEAELARVPAPVPAAVAEPAPPAARPVETARRDWERQYLRTRVEALQAELCAMPPLPAADAAPDAPGPVASAPATVAPVEEEMARLRWRVRFLEGRLAYFEGNGAAPAPAGQAEAAAESGTAPRVADAILGQLQAADERAEADLQDPQQPVRPMALERPFEAMPDDLTLIGGIGPKIQEVLNSLGIWHFDQIAAWTPENIAWVDAYLSFAGRIVREGWVEQARVLAGETAEA